MRMLRGFGALLVLGVGIGCSGPSGAGDTGGSLPADTGGEVVGDSSGAKDSPLPDGNIPDSTMPDTLPDPDAISDAIPDAIPDDDGGADADLLGDFDIPGDTDSETPPVVSEPFGAMSGECGEIDPAELQNPLPFLFTNHIDFADDPYDDADFGLLTPGGQEVILDGNAGGSSILSEAFSFEVLYWCEGAELLKTEMEIEYKDPQGKISDLLVLVDGLKVGVSVTRAVSWPNDAPYPATQAEELLKKKLSGIQASTANVAAQDDWVKQILHVLAWSDGHAAVLKQVWDGLDPALKGDTILLVTVTDGEDSFLY